MRNLLIALTLACTPPALAELQNVEVGNEIRVAGSSSLQLNDPLNATAESTLADQSEIAVTVYNNNRALVRDVRKVDLMPGEGALKFSDVAQQIQPETVSLRSLSTPGELRILEQNYEYDLMSPEKLMEKYVGKQVRLISTDQEDRFIDETATLLSNNGGPVYQVDGNIYLGHPGTVVLPELPEELIAKPSLIWLLDNDGTDHEIEVSYLTGGLSWKADYVVNLNEAEDAINIDAWVTLDNQSGATYTNAQLKLVAGEVNIVQPAPMRRGKGMVEMAYSAMADGAAMQEESFAEYHLYTLPRKTTIKQNQSKQVQMFSASDVEVEKKYEFRGQGWYYSSRVPQFGDEKIATTLVFQNEEENQLGIPLPAGIMRVYQADSSGALQFAGEDRLKHTPKNEEVRLHLGNAFDIVGERKQTNYSVIGNKVHESSYEITLRNHKETNITVDVVEPMMGDWEILKSSIKHKKRDQGTAAFEVPVPADGETVLTYSVRVRTQ